MESIRNVGVHDIRLTIEKLPFHRSIILNFLHVTLALDDGLDACAHKLIFGQESEELQVL